MWIRVKYITIILVIIFMEAAVAVGLSHAILWKCRSFDATKKAGRKTDGLILEDIKCFPVAKQYMDVIDYQDTYGAARKNKGHEGCDIFDRQNRMGEIPIVSATDGVVTNLGWLYLGGYRIGITSGSGIYYYYAHLDSYAAGIRVGKTVNAGELLGFMGNTGEGEEGTKGKFDVHLHFGIYTNLDGDEQTVNPYPYLKQISP